MKLETIIAALELKLGSVLPENVEVSGGYTSDLLSDVMGFAQEGDALITIQAHKNTVAVATLVGCPAIIVCNNRPLPPDMVAAAESEGIAIVLSTATQFEISGKLYRLLGKD